MKTILSFLLLLSPFVVQAQDTIHCMTMPDGAGGSYTNCTSTSTRRPTPTGGASRPAAAPVDPAIAAQQRANEKASIDARNAGTAQQDAKNFEQNQNQIADLRANYAQHQAAGDAFPKDNLKAFNKARKEACKWAPWLPNPSVATPVVSDLDGTPRTCAEAKHFK